MNVFIAGGTGAIGKRLIPLLINSGYKVTSMTRSPGKRELLQKLGADVVIADGLKREDVRKEVLETQPEVIIHQMTSLAGIKNLKNFDKKFELTNRLRREGTDYLIEAGEEAGTKLFIAQSYAGWNYEPTGSGLKSENDPFDPHPSAKMVKALEAIKYLEDKVLSSGIKGIILRYAGFYGPGTGISLNSGVVELIKKRKFPIIGKGNGVWSFIHIDDAASATLAALKKGKEGVYNISDDEPAPVSAWLPGLAEILNAKPPFHLPVWLGKLIAGDTVVLLMTNIKGVSNSKAKAELDWQPLYKSWREGFRKGL